MTFTYLYLRCSIFSGMIGTVFKPVLLLNSVRTSISLLRIYRVNENEPLVTITMILNWCIVTLERCSKSSFNHLFLKKKKCFQAKYWLVFPLTAFVHFLVNCWENLALHQESTFWLTSSSIIINCFLDYILSIEMVSNTLQWTIFWKLLLTMNIYMTEYERMKLKGAAH